MSETIIISRAPSLKVPPWAQDWPVLVGIGALAAVAVAVGNPAHGPTSSRHGVELVGFLLLGAVVLLGRHRHPLAAMAIVAAVALERPTAPPVVIPLLFALFMLAAHSPSHGQTTAGILVAALVLIFGPLLHDDWHGQLPVVVPRLVAIAFALAAGLYLQTRRAHVDGLRERAVRMERERSLLADQAVADERLRIARELHDVVAHSVSLMVVQAQAAQATGSAEQRPALEGIADAGREALAEMHRMLGVLRTVDPPAVELAPAPGIRDLDVLVERARIAGLEVTMDVEGDPQPLPAGVDLSAYRIVQEAITNVVKHSRASRTAVVLRYRPDALELSVTDEGSGPDQTPSRGPDPKGHGLVGMRERVALFGGSLVTGASEDGTGYAVKAVLPL